ncbi:hypothetical protein [Mycetocola sp. JXN-3]|uniref:hypothetical protein n=1 Tax=Mycetocola sp. JXN-3 TaxID=2116510 RepID=UPI00165D0B5B|nr:hypothetical protein [Mycetocola sp. JXN-3]
MARHELVSYALLDFQGVFRTLLSQNSGVEAEDRGRLAGKLIDLADLVREARVRADQERDRLSRVEAWKQREEERQRRAVTGDPSPYIVEPLVDAPPRDPVVRAPSIAVSFRPGERRRSVGAVPFWGSVSADPEHLRGYAGGWRRHDGVLGEELSRFRGAWAGFVASCSWVPVGTMSLSEGFEGLLRENQSDAAWMESVAGAFEQAGGGELSALQVVLAIPVDRVESLQGLLTSGSLSAQEVAQAWAVLSGEAGFDESGFIFRFANVLGSLDGLPALVRVRANQERAGSLIRVAEVELAEALALTGGDEAGRAGLVAYLRHEIKYLQQVSEGNVQLYLYERDQSRVVEMVGMPGPDTVRAVTYVPGTFTNMNSFFEGGVQKISKFLVDEDDTTVAFVYKDGRFPGEQPRSVRAPWMFRIVEANAPGVAERSGETLSRFERGMRLDPSLSSVKYDAIGHSWGLTNVTSSEVSGTRYDGVVSLAGAGMLEAWRANPDTAYADFSYDDVLQRGQLTGEVWGGRNPRSTGAFEKGPYYRGPDDGVLDQGRTEGRLDGEVAGVLMENHNLVATNEDANRQLLADLQKWMG